MAVELTHKLFYNSLTIILPRYNDTVLLQNWKQKGAVGNFHWGQGKAFVKSSLCFKSHA